MKIRVLYESNIKNGHKEYTIIDIPDGDYSVMLDIDYEQRLAEAKPEKRAEVKRCETVQEMFDLMNTREYNNWHKHEQREGFYKGQGYEHDGEDDSTEAGGTWCEPLFSEVRDNSIFRRDEIARESQWEYEDVCAWIRTVLAKKPAWAEAFIAVRIDGESIRSYAARVGDSENNITQKLNRAAKKLRENYFSKP
ncbi:sigma-70 family RNA polymerase sigma factor [Gemmiger formicilis]